MYTKIKGIFVNCFYTGKKKEEKKEQKVEEKKKGEVSLERKKEGNREKHQ